MKYRDIIGYSKKTKKIIKEQSKPKPKKNTIIEGIKKELNEWNDTTFRNKPKRWSNSKGLTEFEQTGGKDTLKENNSRGWALDWESEIAQLINSKELKSVMKDKDSKVKSIAQRLRKNLIQVHIGFDGLKDELKNVYGEGVIKEVGMASDIKKYQKAIDEDMMSLADSVNKLKDLLIKNGAEREAKELGSIFVTNVGKFRKFIKIKFIRMIRNLI